MNQRLMLIAVLLTALPAFGQVKLGTNALNVAPAAAKPWAVTKTPDGQPDLQGYWTNNTMTPLQRPRGVTKEFYTKEEFFEALKKQAERDGEEATPGTVEDVHYDHSQFGLDRTQGLLTPNLRTSMIIDPPDGRIPPLTARGTKTRCRPGGGKEASKALNTIRPRISRHYALHLHGCRPDASSRLQQHVSDRPEPGIRDDSHRATS